MEGEKPDGLRSEVAMVVDEALEQTIVFPVATFFRKICQSKVIHRIFLRLLYLF